MNKDDKVNLEHSSVLLIDDNQQALDMLGSIVQGFGVREQIKLGSATAAVKLLEERPVDLIIIDCDDPEMDSYAFTRWLRAETPPPMKYTPVILVTGHASKAKVQEGRDCGVSFVVVKPLTPKVLLKRVMWLAVDEREFIECPTYVGPDRRVRNYGPPLGEKGRRQGDLSAHIGIAKEANMDQSDIDALLRPQKVQL